MSNTSELTLAWSKVCEMLQERFGKVPDLEGIIYLVGVNEVGFHTARKFKKEEKQDLMHVAMCTLLADDGFYEFSHTDQDGWPHFNKLKDFPHVNLPEQELYLKEKLVAYFNIA